MPPGFPIEMRRGAGSRVADICDGDVTPDASSSRDDFRFPLQTSILPDFILPTSSNFYFNFPLPTSASHFQLQTSHVRLQTFFGRRNPLLDKRIPLVALRALPEQLRAAVAAADADVRVEVEDGVAGEVDVAGDERLRQVERGERVPDRLMERRARGGCAPALRRGFRGLPAPRRVTTGAGPVRAGRASPAGWPRSGGGTARGRGLSRSLSDTRPRDARTPGRRARGTFRSGAPTPGSRRRRRLDRNVRRQD